MNLRLAPWLAAVLLGASLVATAAPALAHSPATPPASVERQSPASGEAGPEALIPAGAPQARELRAQVGGPTVPAAIAVLALLFGALVGRRRPRLAISALAVATLVVLAFESGLHSVHHLGDERGAGQCSVASATTHLAGTTDEPPSVIEPIVLTSESLAGRSSAARPTDPFRLDAGRAPPRHTA